MLAAIELSRATSSRIQPVTAPDDPVVADALAELRQLTEELRGVSSDPARPATAAGIGAGSPNSSSCCAPIPGIAGIRAGRTGRPVRIRSSARWRGRATGVTFFESGQVCTP